MQDFGEAHTGADNTFLAPFHTKDDQFAKTGWDRLDKNLRKEMRFLCSAEIRYSSNVTMYGAKSENNYVVIWVRDSDLVTLHGYGGNASPFANKTDASGRRQDGRVAAYMPSQFRVQRSTRVRLANLMDAGRVTDPVRTDIRCCFCDTAAKR